MKKILTILTMLILLSTMGFAMYTEGENYTTQNGKQPRLMQHAEEKIMEHANGTPELRKEMKQNMEQKKEEVKQQIQKNLLEIKEEKNKRFLKLQNKSIETKMEFMEEAKKIKAKLSNGRFAELKVMPETASKNAMDRLRLKVCSEENNCTLELKEVKKGNETRAAYRIQAEKEIKLFGLFKKKMQVDADVDAETGEVIKSHKPWWAFLASE